MVLLTAGISAADRETLPGEVLLLSDEIFGNSVDATNPNQGSGTGNAPNEGTDNPNNADSDDS
jgi:hypothetical protein